MGEFERLPAATIQRIRKQSLADGLDLIGFAWSVEAEAERAIVAQLAALLPGCHYMDPPDGGSVTVMEQLRRMSEDAAKWRNTAAQFAAELERAQTDAYAEGRKDEAEEARKFLRPRFARMLEALDALVSMCEVHGDFSNGVTDPAGSIDEGVVRASELIRAGRAAIASIRTTGESTDA